MAAPLLQRPDVEMGIDIDDADPSRLRDIAQIVSIGCLVATSDDDGNGAALENRRDDAAESLLALLEVCRDAQIAEIERRPQVDVVRRIRDGEATKPAADRARGLCRSGASMIATDPLVLRKAKQDRTPRLDALGITRPGFDELTESRIIASRQRGFRRGRRQQRIPLGLV